VSGHFRPEANTAHGQAGTWSPCSGHTRWRGTWRLDGGWKVAGSPGKAQMAGPYPGGLTSGSRRGGCVLDGVSVEQSGKMEGEGSRGPTQPGHVVGREGDEGRPIGRVGATHVLSGGAREAERGGGGSRGGGSLNRFKIVKPVQMDSNSKPNMFKLHLIQIGLSRGLKI
jgi:hypothetical protein